jgi:hypothetical protein
MGNQIRDVIAWCLEIIPNCVRYYKYYRPLEREKDPFKHLEKRLWIEMAGIGLGGMASSGAYASFKKDYYEKLPTKEAKSEVRRVLMTMLKSEKYDINEKRIIAYVCSDLRIEETEEDISLVQEAAARGMTLRQLMDLKRKQVIESKKNGLS